MADKDNPTIDLDQYRGRKGALGAQEGDAGWRALHERFRGNLGHATEFLSYRGSEAVRRQWVRLGLARTGAGKRHFCGNGSEPPAETPEAGLADDILRHLTKCADEQHTIVDLADSFDTSPKRIEAALTQLSAQGYSIEVARTEEDGLRRARLTRRAPGKRGALWSPGWGDTELRLGYVSDTHLGNLCACRDELEAAYDKFVSEGVQDVLHSGDLTDGPGNRSFPGHADEVEFDCQNAEQLVEYTIAHYPRRPGLATHFIASSKSHDGWELRATGRSIPDMIVDGFTVDTIGAQGWEHRTVAGREDMRFLGYDSAILGVGPEGATRIQLVHPDGGTAYALSYQPQKWAESLEGGTKPDVALLGHYHKLNWIRERNIQVLTGECMCWQTPFMARKRIAAHVGFFILDLTLDADGTVRSFLPREFPFFFGERRVIDLGRKAA